MKTVSLETDFEKELNKSEIPFCEYPRPQLKRDSFLCLNGKWDFKILNNGETAYSGEILSIEIIIQYEYNNREYYANAIRRG